MGTDAIRTPADLEDYLEGVRGEDGPGTAEIVRHIWAAIGPDRPSAPGATLYALPVGHGRHIGTYDPADDVTRALAAVASDTASNTALQFDRAAMALHARIRELEEQLDAATRSGAAHARRTKEEHDRRVAHEQSLARLEEQIVALRNDVASRDFDLRNASDRIVRLDRAHGARCREVNDLKRELEDLRTEHATELAAANEGWDVADAAIRNEGRRQGEALQRYIDQQNRTHAGVELTDEQRVAWQGCTRADVIVQAEEKHAAAMRLAHDLEVVRRDREALTEQVQDLDGVVRGLSDDIARHVVRLNAFDAMPWQFALEVSRGDGNVQYVPARDEATAREMVAPYSGEGSVFQPKIVAAVRGWTTWPSSVTA